eukprot:gb/GEZJ01002849.1/.p1 GENE.gb/GEZJ01002849.1/~~gb/GEZJ01002849.1/.p1  ORF type:complete len:114 (-),score=7.32 gb/GEZJ01002849.1/:252-593(-)
MHTFEVYAEERQIDCDKHFFLFDLCSTSLYIDMVVIRNRSFNNIFLVREVASHGGKSEGYKGQNSRDVVEENTETMSAFSVERRYVIRRSTWCINVICYLYWAKVLYDRTRIK